MGQNFSSLAGRRESDDLYRAMMRIHGIDHQEPKTPMRDQLPAHYANVRTAKSPADSASTVEER